MKRPFQDIPNSFESSRLLLRSYKAGDGPLYYRVGQKNRKHLQRYESDNVVLEAKDENEAEEIVKDLAEEWNARRSFFIGAFDKQKKHFIAQIYVGSVNRELPEFQIGFFVDVDYEGQGYMTEAVKATLEFIFNHLKAYRISAECDETNIRSKKVLERCGMTKEGLLRENNKNADGTITGTVHYGLLKKEYK